MSYAPGVEVWVDYCSVWYRAVVAEAPAERIRAMAGWPGIGLTRAVAIRLVEGFDHHKCDMSQDVHLVIPEPTSDKIMRREEIA